MTHPRYQEWLSFVFDHPVTEPQWYFQPDAPHFSGNETDFAELITQTFLRSGADLQRFPNAQVNQGLWFLVSPSGGDYIFSLRDGHAPLTQKVQGIHSILDLYRDCFAPRCAQVLGHTDEAGASDLNSICYMFWDICPLTYLEKATDRPALEEAVFSVLEKTLLIEHRACREGALHGLGEIAYAYPERVSNIVGSFLAKAEVDAVLKSYAERAQHGNVL
jgi:hypothetical protein